jgi:hypothetical protein
MKKLVITLCEVVAAMTLSNCSKEELKPGADLPNKVKTYITTHFPDQFITEAKINENDSVNMKYPHNHFRLVRDCLMGISFADARSSGLDNCHFLRLGASVGQRVFQSIHSLLQVECVNHAISF